MARSLGFGRNYTTKICTISLLIHYTKGTKLTGLRASPSKQTSVLPSLHFNCSFNRPIATKRSKQGVVLFQLSFTVLLFYRSYLLLHVRSRPPSFSGGFPHLLCKTNCERNSSRIYICLSTSSVYNSYVFSVFARRYQLIFS